MRTGFSLAVAAMLSFLPVSAVAEGDSWNAEKLYDWDLHQAYMKKVEDALGVFHDIEVWDRSSPDENWNLLTGAYVPVTVDNKTLTQDEYFKDMRSDRPMLLPTRVEGFSGGDGQSNPYNVVGRMPGSNPEVQWVFMVRKYRIKDQRDADFVDAGDIAIIGHHPRTGASTYFQFYDPANPKPSRIVISPFSGKAGMKFWSPLVTNAKVFQCQRCHNADPFIHSPWVDQVRVTEPKDGEPFPEPMVPSNPLGAFYFIDAEETGLFNFWNDWLRHLEAPKSTCNECHRVTPFDLAGLYQNSTQYAGLERSQYDQFAVEMHGYQTDNYTDLPWMPPVTVDDFYAGQSLVGQIWKEAYEADAAEVNLLTPEDSQKLKRVPSPPKPYRSIMVDRPQQDDIPANGSVVIVDTRMRANTDGTLAQWRFFAKQGASDEMLAAPVVFNIVPGDGSTIQFKVAYVGDARNVSEGQNWTSVTEGKTFDLKQGDYLGLLLINKGDQSGPGLVPHTQDKWAEIIGADGTTRKPDGVVTYRASAETSVAVGDVIDFKQSDYLTYSFEMRNDL